MSEPTVAYPIRDVLARIEGKLDKMADQIREFEVEGSKTAREALAEGHSLELRVQALEMGAATSAAARRALVAASGSPLVAALVAWLIARK